MILVASGLFTIFGSVLLMNLETPPSSVRAHVAKSIDNPASAGKHSNHQPAEESLAENSTRPHSPSPFGASIVSQSDINALSGRDLLIPVAGVTSLQLHDSFYDSRSEGRMHKAIDIMAPRDTPVLATAAGRVLKLHQSDRGGIMLYQSDESGGYVYYYGHLSRYADGIAEGMLVKRGEVIAFVGDTGNAGSGNCHLHFGISKMKESGRWSGGEPINPYPLLTRHPETATEAGK
jgi:murein DD-endopeptidase MepM/ murein hydrolase activator NlpD